MLLAQRRFSKLMTHRTHCKILAEACEGHPCGIWLVATGIGPLTSWCYRFSYTTGLLLTVPDSALLAELAYVTGLHPHYVLTRVHYHDVVQA